MKKILILLFFISSIVYSQDIVHINSVSDIEKIKEENKGNVLLINFWATWCKPCTEEFPGLVKLYNNYKDNNFKLIFISLDFKEEVETKLKPFLSNNKVGFVTYYLSTKNSDDIMNYFDKKWDGGIPATFIFNKSGVLVNETIGSKEYVYFENAIKDLL